MEAFIERKRAIINTEDAQKYMMLKKCYDKGVVRKDSLERALEHYHKVYDSVNPVIDPWAEEELKNAS